ncbi:MAG TPA: hypothetical protein VFW94_24135 [Candidatus Acidoferrales bacterium]|nr:hypothetical protein [Candidatus Acidoferrales bacterium]
MSDKWYEEHRGICDKCCVSSIETEKIGEKCEHCKDGTIVYNAPYAERVEPLPEPMTCRRRFDQYVGGAPVHLDQGENQDHWDRHKSNGDRVCSYCGSLHPDDFLRLVHEAATAPDDASHGTVPEIEPSDKGYKIYVHQPGVRNAMEGGIKFYTHHLPRDAEGKLTVTEEQNQEYALAVRRSQIRFERYVDHLQERFSGRRAEV